MMTLNQRHEALEAALRAAGVKGVSGEDAETQVPLSDDAGSAYLHITFSGARRARVELVSVDHARARFVAEFAEPDDVVLFVVAYVARKGAP